MNNMAKKTTFSNHGGREMEFVLCDGRDNGEYIGIAFVERYEYLQSRTFFSLGANIW